MFIFLSYHYHQISGSQSHSGSQVKWTFYPEISVSWNIAAQFCFQQGGTLPLLSTQGRLDDFVAAIGDEQVTDAFCPSQ